MKQNVNHDVTKDSPINCDIYTCHMVITQPSKMLLETDVKSIKVSHTSLQPFVVRTSLLFWWLRGRIFFRIFQNFTLTVRKYVFLIFFGIVSG